MMTGVPCAILLLLLFDFLLLAYLFHRQGSAGTQQRLTANAIDLPRLYVAKDSRGLVMVRTLREFTEESDGVDIPQNTLLWCLPAEAWWLAQLHWAWPQWAVDEPE